MRKRKGGVANDCLAVVGVIVQGRVHGPKSQQKGLRGQMKTDW